MATPYDPAANQISERRPDEECAVDGDNQPIRCAPRWRLMMGRSLGVFRLPGRVCSVPELGVC